MNENLPAFPLYDPQAPAADYDWTHGLSKKEYFVAMAMQGMLAGGLHLTHEEVAARAYDVAIETINLIEEKS